MYFCAAGVQTVQDFGCLVKKYKFRVEFALRGHKRHFQGVRNERWRQRLLFGRWRRHPSDQISESVAGLSGAAVRFRFRVREKTVVATTVGGHTRGVGENTAAASAQDIVDPGPEKRHDKDGSGHHGHVVRQANATRHHTRGT